MRLSEPEIRRRFTEWRNLKQLHAEARHRVLLLTDKLKRLKGTQTELQAENKKLRDENERLKEQLAKEHDVNQKLRAMLFEKQHGKIRTQRLHQPKPRTPASYTRPAPTSITEQKELLLSHCPDCGTPVEEPVSSRKRIIEDIMFQPQPSVVEWTLHRHWCTGCGKQMEGTIPGILPKSRIGPNTLTFVIMAKYRWNQPYEKIQDQLEICFGLHISQGEIAHLIAAAAMLVGEKWSEIRQAVKAGAAVHCDETGWFIDGKKVWAHTFATEYAVLYEISSTRGKAVAENQLQDFAGTRITDCLPNYKNLSGSHQICWAHLTREAQENAERQPASQERQRVRTILDLVYSDLRAVAADWKPRAAVRVRHRCERRVRNLLKQRWRDEKSRLLAQRLQDFRSALFTCLTAPGIPPDNNHAERILRKIVVQRKISGGNRSPDHADYHARLMSVIETLRLEGGQLLPKLQAVLQQGMVAQLAYQ